MTSASTLSAFSNDPDLAARAILDASQPVHKTPPRKEHSNDDVVTFTPSGVATPARLQAKSQSGHPSPKVPEFNVLASSGQLSSCLASSARRPPLPCPNFSLPSAPHPTSESSSPFTNFIHASPNFLKPGSATTPAGFADTGQTISTPSAIFGQLQDPGSAQTPFALMRKSGSAVNCTPPSSSVDFPHSSIPLTFSAAGTPIAFLPTAASPSPQNQPNPAVIASFFRQRSAHITSPIFHRIAIASKERDLSSPLIRANPLADSDNDAAALPPSVIPLRVQDVKFSLESGFETAPTIHLSKRATRVPLPYAIRLTLIDSNGPIHPIAVRLERCFKETPTMFLAVISGNVDLKSSICADPSTVPKADIMQSALDKNWLTFWAAPDAEAPNGSASPGVGRMLLTVTDDEYDDHEVPIIVTVSPTTPRISVEAPGYPARQMRAETNISFLEHDHDCEALVTVWNETEGDAPLLLNVVIQDSAGGAFTIGETSENSVDCIPLLVKSGSSRSFRTRFRARPELTFRPCYYGCVLIKYAFVMVADKVPGHDLELHQYFDHVLNLTASIGSRSENANSSRDSVEKEAALLHSGSDEECLCSDLEEHPEAPCSLVDGSRAIQDNLLPSPSIEKEHTAIHDEANGLPPSAEEEYAEAVHHEAYKTSPSNDQFTGQGRDEKAGIERLNSKKNSCDDIETEILAHCESVASEEHSLESTGIMKLPSVEKHSNDCEKEIPAPTGKSEKYPHNRSNPALIGVQVEKLRSTEYDEAPLKVRSRVTTLDEGCAPISNEITAPGLLGCPHEGGPSNDHQYATKKVLVGTLLEGDRSVDVMESSQASQEGVSITNEKVTAKASLPMKHDIVAKAHRPWIKMPRRIRERGIVVPQDKGSVVFPLLNASSEVVEVTISVETTTANSGKSRQCVSVSPDYLVIGSSEIANVTMVRTCASAAEHMITLRSSTVGMIVNRRSYRVPVHVEASMMLLETTEDFSVDRPTMTFYNPSDLDRVWKLRIRNGTDKQTKYSVWIEEGNPFARNSNGKSPFRVVNTPFGLVDAHGVATICVAFDGDDKADHFHGRLNIRVGTQTDFMPLFGYSGSADIQLGISELGHVQVRNVGDRYGFVVITGPESDFENNVSLKAVLSPGEERELKAPYGTGSIVYTGDEITRSRLCRADEFRRDPGGQSHHEFKSVFKGEFEKQELAIECEEYNWDDEDIFGSFYSGRLFDHHVHRYMFDLNGSDRVSFVEKRRPDQCGWSASVENGFIHIENLDLSHELTFTTDGTKPSKGSVAAFGDAMLAPFKETVEVHAQGKTETLHVRFPPRSSGTGKISAKGKYQPR